VQVESLFNVYSYPTSQTVLVAYLTRYLDGVLTPGDEESEARIFTPKDIPWQEIAFSSSRDALREYLKLTR